MRLFVCLAFFPGLLVFMLGGCSNGSKVDSLVGSLNKSNIQRLSNLYNKYQSQHDWVGPESMDVLKEYVRGLPETRLERMGVDVANLESLFISERDGKEFVVRPGVQGSAMGSVQPVVFEQDGLDGKWMKGFTSRAPREASSKSEYDEWMNGNWQEPVAAQRPGEDTRPEQ